MKKSNEVLLPEFERLIKNGHTVEFTPKGVSMRPFIEGGRDSVLLRQPRTLKVGHIVLARVQDTFVLHRIVKITDDTITLRGDGNLTGYEQCPIEDVIGYVVRIKGRGGVRKRLTKGRVWRYLPTFIKAIVLKVYRKIIQWKPTEYED
jgi:hypothetical protein